MLCVWSVCVTTTTTITASDADEIRSMLWRALQYTRILELLCDVANDVSNLTGDLPVNGDVQSGKLFLNFHYLYSG